MKAENKGMIYGLIAVVAFGLTLPATRHVVQWLDPYFIGLGRAVVAAVFAATILLLTKQALPSKDQLPLLLITAIGVILGFPILSSIAMNSVPASHGGVVIAIVPILTAVVASFISHERPSLAFWISGVLGAILVAIFALQKGGLSFHTGDTLLFLASLSAAIGYATGGKLAQTLGGWQVICWALVISFPFIIIPAYSFAPNDWTILPTSAVLAFLYLALVSQLSGFFLWYHGLALGGIARVSQTQLIQPFVTLTAAYFLLGEVLDKTTLIFAIAVVAVLAINKRTLIKRSDNPEPETP